MIVRFNVDPDKMSLNDYLLMHYLNDGTLVTGSIKEVLQVRKMLSHIAVDENGASLDPLSAEEMVGDLPLGDIKRAFSGVQAKVKEIRTEAVPPTNGDSSS